MKSKGWRTINYSMAFEIAMMQFFGEKGHHIASHAGNETLTKKWLLKAIQRMMRNVDEIDTTVRHKEKILSDIGHLEDAIKKWDNPEEIIFIFFMLCGKLLGYCGYKARCHTPVYWQTEDQCFTTAILQGGNAEQDYRIGRKNIVSVRKKLIQDLKRDGHDDFKISLILNTTEYEVKKLRRSTDANG